VAEWSGGKRRALIAHHEAAHAVVGLGQGLTFSAIYVGDAGGQVLFDPQWPAEEVVRDPALLDRYGLMLLAAAYAEHRWTGRVVGVEDDIEVLATMLDEARIRGTVPRPDLWRRAERQVAERWAAIAALADELAHHAERPANQAEIAAAYPHLGARIRGTSWVRAREVVGPLLTDR
jgi:hypothetical protein